MNDSYRTDLILMYPPFMIALACIYIASVLKEKDTRSWFEELRVDMNVVKALPSASTLTIELKIASLHSLHEFLIQPLSPKYT